MISKGLITVDYDAGQSKIRAQLSFFRSKPVIFIVNTKII